MGLAEYPPSVVLDPPPGSDADLGYMDKGSGEVPSGTFLRSGLNFPARVDDTCSTSIGQEDRLDERPPSGDRRDGSTGEKCLQGGGSLGRHG